MFKENASKRIKEFKDLKALASLMTDFGINSDDSSKLLLKALNGDDLGYPEEVYVSKKVKKYFACGTKTAQVGDQLKKYVDNVIKPYMEDDSYNADVVDSFTRKTISGGDGHVLGIVLTPPVFADFMAELLDVEGQTVIDPCCGSGSLLVGASRHKPKKLIGVEYQQNLADLAQQNLDIQCKDTPHQVIKGDIFKDLSKLEYTRVIINPPYATKQKGMDFVDEAIKHLQPGGRAVVLIQENAGLGKGAEAFKSILKSCHLEETIKAPTYLFTPMASVQTAVYVFVKDRPHDFEHDKVTFINFDDDGYHRTKKSLSAKSSPVQAYQKVLSQDLDKDHISHETIGKDCNDVAWMQHYHQSIIPTAEDFMKVVGDYMDWKFDEIRKQARYEAIEDLKKLEAQGKD